MEDELAGLTLNEEEDTILQVQIEPNIERGEEVFRGVHIRDLGEKRFLFQIYHVMDLDRIHDVPIGLFSKNLAVQLGNFVGEFIEYDGSNLGKENRNYMQVRVRIDVRRPLKRRKQILFCGNCTYVRFSSVTEGCNNDQCMVEIRRGWETESLEGRKNLVNHMGKNSMLDQALTDMEHDLEDGFLIGEEGKKRAKEEMEGAIVLGNENSPASKNIRLLEVNHFVSAAAKRQDDWAQ
ncbi:hypothetical protein Golob_015007 [Gossypium lobatum]|uniref:DUF4283 domain-containing protein n=1 Tax=Gossypium lobatum TaxID=34289 RepID=A0A7J8LZX3_9ROSI|nr:hypothetical protein [Gossypium lobatum]